MNSFNLKINGFNNLMPIIEIDGEEVKLKKNKYGNQIATISSNYNSVQINIYTPIHELNRNNWFFMSMLFFIISIFGIFDKRYNKKFYTLSYEGYLNFNNGETITLKFNNLKSGKKAITCDSIGFEDNYTNAYTIDQNAKRHYKILKYCKLFMWFLLILGIVFFVIQ